MSSWPEKSDRLAVALDDVVGEGAEGVGFGAEVGQSAEGGIGGAAGEGAGGVNAEDFGVSGFVLFEVAAEGFAEFFGVAF